MVIGLNYLMQILSMCYNLITRGQNHLAKLPVACSHKALTALIIFSHFPANGRLFMGLPVLAHYTHTAAMQMVCSGDQTRLSWKFVIPYPHPSHSNFHKVFSAFLAQYGLLLCCKISLFYVKHCDKDAEISKFCGTSAAFPFIPFQFLGNRLQPHLPLTHLIPTWLYSFITREQTM
jgi:hypothetical protein